MTVPPPDTIAAIASGAGRAAIAVLRLSGPQAGPVLVALAGRLPAPRRASLATLRDPATGEPVDRALVLWFPAPNSFTGEDCAEIHLHGGRAVVRAALRAVTARPGTRLAEPGEFTRRAFERGRLDLAAVEGLADLIEAETEAQRRQALAQLSGALGREVEAWREALTGALALLEASLDFADEGDVQGSDSDEATAARAMAGTERVAAGIEAALRTASRGERLREGLTIVIAGPPNAGKSTLLNALGRREAAIVSPHPGTTRDAIEVPLDLNGLPVTLVDTAGLRPSDDPVEREGMARARARAERADCVLWLSPLSEPAEPEVAAPSLIRVATKADLAPHAPPPPGAIPLSAVTGAGLDALLDALGRLATDRLGGGDALVTQQRHRLALEDTQAALAEARAATSAGLGAELVAEDLRRALRALGRITGRVDVEEVLGAIFSRFCIGK